MNLSRRKFWSFAAPAIVLAPNIMRVSAAALENLPSINETMQRYSGYDTFNFSELVTSTLRNHAGAVAENVRMTNALWQYLAERDAA